MNVTWFIEPYVFSLSENLTPLKDEILRQGHKIEEVRYIPFVNDEYKEMLCETKTPGVFYGSLNMAKFIQHIPEAYRPIVYCTMRNYDCSRYCAYFGKYLLNGRYAMVPYAELKRNKGFLFGALGCDDAIFVRPNTGDKVFTGQLVYLESFDKDYERMGTYDMTPEQLVVVSEPRNLIGEWRFVVVEKKIVSWSAYKKSEPAPAEAVRLAEEIAASGYEPDACWVLDVCKTKDGEFYLLEIGSFSCAGLYKCDMEPIVREVSLVVLKQHEMNMSESC